MNSEQEQKIIAFIQWLPQNIQRFEGIVPEKTFKAIASAKSTEEVAAALDACSKEQGGDEIISHMVEVFQESQKAEMFAKGGKLEQLLNKYQIGGSLRESNKLNAYRGSYPDRQTMERGYIDRHGANTKNVFSRNSLEHYVVTSGINGVPRRPTPINVITNYDIPAKSGTTYIDANKLKDGRNPGFFRRLFGNFHTPEVMNSANEKLKKANQYSYLEERY